MPTLHRRITFNLHDGRPLRALGYDYDAVGARDIHGALGRYAGLVVAAGDRLAREFDREDWHLLAQAFRDLAGDPGPFPDAAALLGAIRDALGPDADRARLRTWRIVLEALAPVDIEAILAAVRFYWSRPDLRDDPGWFRPSRRLEGSPEEALARQG